MVQQYHSVDGREVTLAKQWTSEGQSFAEIGRRLGRHRSTIKHLIERAKTPRACKTRRRVGRPEKLSPQQQKALIRTVQSMTRNANARYQVTAAMLRKALKLKVCDRTILTCLHKHGIYMHRLREKPVRTTQDISDRKAFAQKFVGKPASFWTHKVHAYLDNKTFPVYLTHKGRTYAAKQAAKGTFRRRGEGLGRGHVKPRKGMKYGGGTKPVMIACALSRKGVLMWHEVRGPWNAANATKMYAQALHPALKAQNPGARTFLVLEDNDPSGYKSRAAVAEKSRLHVNILAIPKRSPDLNPLDYGFWAEVNRRLRRQELKFAEGKKESRQEFLVRLRRTAKRVPEGVCAKLISSMKRRVADLETAAGGDFEE